MLVENNKGGSMKALSKTANKVFQAVINSIPQGQTSHTLDAGNQKHGGSIMALHVEKIGQNHFGEIFSFAHYYEQNGDLMRDPDITMLKAGVQLFPLSYRQDNLGIDREYVRFNETSWSIAKRHQADLAVFCTHWARNIKNQQSEVLGATVAEEVAAV